MRYRTAYASLTVVALIAAAIVALPFGGDDHPGFPVLDPIPTSTDTIHGVPAEEAPPRTVVTVDRAMVAAVLAGASLEDLAAAQQASEHAPADVVDAAAPDTEEATPEAPPAPPTPDDEAADAPSIEARTGTSGPRDIDPDRLSDSDRELLAALGLLEPIDPGVETSAEDTPAEAFDSDAAATAGSATAGAAAAASAPAASAPDMVHDLDNNRALAVQLTDVLNDHLDIEVEVSAVIGDRFTVTGATPDELEPVPFIADAEPTTYVLLAADQDPSVYDGPGSTESEFAHQWGLHNSGQDVPVEDGTAAEVGVDIRWTEAMTQQQVSGRGVVVAVLDTQIDLDHPELRGRAWRNPGVVCGEAPEEEGQIAGDCHGWNFVDDDWRVSSSGEHAHHGTMMAGVIAAGLNGGDIAGVAPNASIMPLVIAEGPGTEVAVGRIAQAIHYAVDNGADVINASFASKVYSSTPDDLSLGGLRDALVYARDAGVLVVAAAGNEGKDLDATPSYPASYVTTACGEAEDGCDTAAFDFDNLLTVAAIDHRGGMWQGDDGSASNFGAQTVDLTAPGGHILSSVAGGGLAYQSGTSMAVPHVVGVAALLLDREPELRAADLRDAIIAGVSTNENISALALDAKHVSSEGLLSATGPFSGIADAKVVFSSLGGAVEQGATRAELDTTVTATLTEVVSELGAQLTLATVVDGRVHGVVGEPITATAGIDDGLEEGTIVLGSSVEHETDEEGSVELSLAVDQETSTASTTLSVALPEGDYAWVLEFDDGSISAGPFHVGPAEDLRDEEEDDDTTNDDPTNDDTTNDDTTNDDPTNDDTTNDDPTNDNPTNDNPTNDNPTNDNPTNDNPTNDNPTNDDPTNDNPTNDDPTNDDPTNDDPGTGPGVTGPIDPASGHPGDSVKVKADVATADSEDQDIRVTFDGSDAHILEQGPHQLEVRVPDRAEPGVVDVAVYTANAQKYLFEKAFEYLSGSESEQTESPQGRTSGEPIRLSNGLMVVELTRLHPAGRLPSSLWPTSCTTNCGAMQLKDAG